MSAASASTTDLWAVYFCDGRNNNGLVELFYGGSDNGYCGGPTNTFANSNEFSSLQLTCNNQHSGCSFMLASGTPYCNQPGSNQSYTCYGGCSGSDCCNNGDTITNIYPSFCYCEPPSVTYSWVQTSSTGCSASCGGGTWTTTYQCMSSSGTVAPGSSCSGSNPSSSLSCNTEACSYSWSFVSSGTCSVTCGGGTQTSSYNCEDQSGNIVSDSQCSSPTPATTISCNTAVCPHWIGTFNPNSQCDQLGCCCMTGPISASQSGSNAVVESAVSGQCGSTVTVSITAPFPTGYTFTTTLPGGNSATFTLSADGSTITEVDATAPACGGVASRSNTAGMRASPAGPIMIAALLLVAALWN